MMQFIAGLLKSGLVSSSDVFETRQNSFFMVMS